MKTHILAILKSHATWIVLCVLSAWILVGLYLPYCVGAWGSERSGLLGDQFGAVNALFSGLAFGGIILTLSRQQREHESELNYRRATAADAAQQIALQALMARMTAVQALLESTELEYNRKMTEVEASRMTYSQGFEREISRRIDAYRRELRGCIDAVNKLQPLGQD